MGRRNEMKIILSLLVLFFISGCSSSDKEEIKTFQEVTENYQLPDELKNCKVFEIVRKDGYGIPLYVFTCPGASKAVNANCGKGCNLSVNVVETGEVE